MWPSTFEARLESWHLLRQKSQNLNLELTLANINAWWFEVPWRPYYLHWDDQTIWPDPWQLLSDNIYCEIARGLGIVYTIRLLDRADFNSVELVLTDMGHNLVLIDESKYILNWEPNSIVNTFQEVKIHRRYQQHPIT